MNRAGEGRIQLRSGHTDTLAVLEEYNSCPFGVLHFSD